MFDNPLLVQLEIKQLYDYFNPMLSVERGLLKFKPDEVMIRFEVPAAVREFTAAGFVKGVNKFVGMLRNLAVQRRQIVAFCSEDAAQNILAAAGTIKHGTVFLPMDRIDCELLETSRARILFCGLEEALRHAEDLKKLKELWQVVVFAQPPLKLPPGWFPFAEYYPGAEEFREFPPTNTMSGIFYSPELKEEINCWSFVFSLLAVSGVTADVTALGKRASIVSAISGLAAGRKVAVGQNGSLKFSKSLMMLVAEGENAFYACNGGEIAFKHVTPVLKSIQLGQKFFV